MAGVGHFDEDLQRCIFRGRRNTRGNMTWHHFFVASAVTLDRWTGKNAKRIGSRPSALHINRPFFEGRPRRIVSFLMLSVGR